MKLTDLLLGEHGALYNHLEYVKITLPYLRDLGHAQELTRSLASSLIPLARIEEELLFPSIEARIGARGPLALMRADHRELDVAIEDAELATSIGDALEALHRTVQVAKEHFMREEHVLFEIARQIFAPEELEQLGTEWATLRGVYAG